MVWHVFFINYGIRKHWKVTFLALNQKEYTNGLYVKYPVRWSTQHRRIGGAHNCWWSKIWLFCLLGLPQLCHFNDWIWAVKRSGRILGLSVYIDQATVVRRLDASVDVAVALDGDETSIALHALRTASWTVNVPAGLLQLPPSWRHCHSVALLDNSRTGQLVEVVARCYMLKQHQTQRLSLHVLTRHSSKIYIRNVKCGPMPNVMAALPNIGGAICSTPQSLADAHY